MFFYNLEGRMTEAIMKATGHEILAYGSVKSKVGAILDEMGELGFGDLVSGALHD
jgi:hypothetical protein